MKTLQELFDQIKVLEAERQQLIEALVDAAETIHDEFCGYGHHPLCERQIEVMQEFGLTLPHWARPKKQGA